MNPGQRRALLFGAQFLPAFAVLLFLYSWILPPYESAVVGCANAILSRLSPVTALHVEAGGRWRVHLERPDLEANFGIGSEHHATLLFLNLIVLPALLAATPVGARTRLRLVVTGIAILFALHVVFVAGCVYGMGVLNDPKSLVFRSLPRILRLSGQGLTVGLWGALTWRFWFGRGRAEN